MLLPSAFYSEPALVTVGWETAPLLSFYGQRWSSSTIHDMVYVLTAARIVGLSQRGPCTCVSQLVLRDDLLLPLFGWSLCVGPASVMYVGVCRAAVTFASGAWARLEVLSTVRLLECPA